MENNDTMTFITCGSLTFEMDDYEVECRCKCGKKISVMMSEVIGNSKKIKDCGCGINHKKKYPPIKDGDKFGNLTVLREAEFRVHGQRQFLCRCKCGNDTIVRMSNLNDGSTRSCGCGVPSNFKKKSEVGDEEW